MVLSDRPAGWSLALYGAGDDQMFGVRRWPRGSTLVLLECISRVT
jgi:hypothetical protein